MGDAAPRPGITPEEYLAFERGSDIKHEYVNGEIFVLSGGTREHSLASANVTSPWSAVGPCSRTRRATSWSIRRSS